MEDIRQKYYDRLQILKENRAESVDRNTDMENDHIDELIQYTAEFCRDLNEIQTMIRDMS